MGIMAVTFGNKVFECIIPAGQWDGDTGIEKLLEQYRRCGFDADPAEIEQQVKIEEYRQGPKAGHRKHRAPTRVCEVCGERLSVAQFYNDAKNHIRKICRHCWAKRQEEQQRLREERRQQRQLASKGVVRRPRNITIPETFTPVGRSGHYEPCPEIKAIQCRKCHIVKPVSAFNFSPTMRMGYDSACRECRCKEMKAYKKTEAYRNTETYRKPEARKSQGLRCMVKVTSKVCRTCGRELPASEFAPVARNRDGLHYECRECAVKRLHKVNAQRWAKEHERQ